MFVTAIEDQTTINTIVPHNFTDTTWLQYFDPKRALASVAAHIAQLPSHRTPEKYTQAAYSDSLKYFLNWCGCKIDTASSKYQKASLKQILSWSIFTMPLPGPALVKLYIAHLADRNLKSTTISSKYLAPLRHYLDALIDQEIRVTGLEREFVYDCKDALRKALKQKSPRQETMTNLSPLYQHGIRLELGQVNGILRGIDRSTRTGLRDYALLLAAFSSGLRIAELQRMSLDKITRENNVWLLTVRGKRNNMDPIAIMDQLYEAIMAYVEAHNAGLDEDDPRRITDKSALWQPYLHGDHYMPLTVRDYDPDRGFSQDGIRAMFRRRVESVLGQVKSRGGKRFSAHDTRRTFAYLADSAGMKRKNISRAMRHHNTATTDVYIGDSPNYEDWILGRLVKFG